MSGQAKQEQHLAKFEQAENQLVDSLALALAAVARRLYAEEQKAKKERGADG